MPEQPILLSKLVAMHIATGAGFLFGTATVIPIRLPVVYWIGNLLGCTSFATQGSDFEPFRTYLTIVAMLFSCLLSCFVQQVRCKA